MNPIEKALATADVIVAQNAELERLSRNPHLTVLKTGTLSPDGSVTGFTVTATYDPTNRWSGGIARPFVTRQEADRIVKHTSAAIQPGDEGSVYWEGEFGESATLAYVDYDGVNHVNPDHNGLYEVGFGWCWEEVEDRPSPANSTVVALGVAHQNAVNLAKTQIVEDITDPSFPKAIPTNIDSFSALHDYADANEYGGLCNPALYGSEKFDTAEQWTAFCNGVQDALDGWIKDGGIVKAIDALHNPVVEVEERKTLVLAFDVTGWTEEQIGDLVAECSAQGEENDAHPHTFPAEATYDHAATITVFDALQVGLGL